MNSINLNVLADFDDKPGDSACPYSLLIQINFFENWLTFGHGKAEALRQAQLNMINLLKNNPTYDFPHPYFWAAATLTGLYY